MMVALWRAWKMRRSRTSTRSKVMCNVGFFNGAMLNDPAGLLEGNGKRMRHVKLKPGQKVDAAALRALIDAAYADIKTRLAAE